VRDGPINNNGAHVFKVSEGIDWERFDRLPKAVKRIYWYAPFRLSPTSAKMRAINVPAMLERRRVKMAASTKMTYGEDHPDAEGVVLF
jgi:hypothetical protein